MKFNATYWIRYSLLNLLMVSALGVLMRYKIAFDFPIFSQKNIQHAHSHFAFLGWITHSIYVFLIQFICRRLAVSHLRPYKTLLTLNLVCSYGMIISFFFQGYGTVSIALSFLTIVISGCFAYFFLKDFSTIGHNDPAIPWFKAAVFFNILSSAGTLYLAYMIASKNFNEHWYLASVYFYLHFQYNGFFTFSCLGLTCFRLPELLPKFRFNRHLFTLFFASAIPTYFLSTLWANLPGWLYVIVVIATFVQLLAWIWFIIKIRKSLREVSPPLVFIKNIFLFVSIAFSVKLLLQLGSTIPAVGKIAFGFRPIVIGYLHLVLLAVISVFILGYAYANIWIRNNKSTRMAIRLFLIGILLNELALAAQGIAAFNHKIIPSINEILFVLSLAMLLGVSMINLSQEGTT